MHRARAVNAWQSTTAALAHMMVEEGAGLSSICPKSPLVRAICVHGLSAH
jgi:hypothetical protein